MAETEEDAPAMAMTMAAREAGDAGWLEIERKMSALELPPVPPTSDPQRLLSYVLNILPRYAEMEMASTHLRLYASTLEQDLEQVKGHVRILTREAEGEREKKQFLERYAAQVVKVRNELLHSRGGTRQHQKKGVAHFVWHSCCKKNQHYTLDVTPSLATFRGEKLQERAKQVQSLEEEVHNMELLRRELDYLLKKSQREHDSKVAAQAKQIQQLEKQVLQRSMLHSSLERKLYDVESALALHDNAKVSELAVFGDQLKDARDRIEKLQEKNTQLQREVDELAADRDRLASAIESTTETKDAYALQIDQLTFKCTALGSEVEALRSEIRILQTNDLNDVQSQYSARLKKLQDDAATTERTMSLEIDRLRHELARKNETVAQHQDGIQPVHPTTRRNDDGGNGDAADISLPLVSGWDHDLPETDFLSKSEALSRSQLSSSVVSSKCEDDSMFDDSRRSRHSLVLAEMYSDDDGEDEVGSISDVSPSSSAAHFNWESFIESDSALSLPEAKRTRRMVGDGANTPGLETRSQSSHRRSQTSTHERYLTDKRSSRSRFSDNGSAAASFTSTVRRRVTLSGSEHGVPRSVDYEFEEEEEKEEPSASDTSSDLVRDLHSMLNGFEQKRKQEEEKAARAEEALLDFQRVQEDLQQLQVAPSS